MGRVCSCTTRGTLQRLVSRVTPRIAGAELFAARISDSLSNRLITPLMIWYTLVTRYHDASYARFDKNSAPTQPAFKTCIVNTVTRRMEESDRVGITDSRNEAAAEPHSWTRTGIHLIIRARCRRYLPLPNNGTRPKRCYRHYSNGHSRFRGKYRLRVADVVVHHLVSFRRIYTEPGVMNGSSRNVVPLITGESRNDH